MTATDPRQVLVDCHMRLRRGAFDRSLLDDVTTHDRTWATLEDEAEWLEGRAVASEIYDYFGDYKNADACLARSDPRFARALNSSLDGSVELEKRRIWLMIALAHVRYRAEHYEKSLDDLQGCIARLHHLDPHESLLFGTRSRLCYSLGQIARQGQRYGQALRHFGDSCHYAEERFRRKTGFIELTSPPSRPLALEDDEQEELQNERMLAMWVIGKCLALGIGWIEYVTGNLSAARTSLSAGYSMLRGTEDWVHRAYAQMLLAACERARAGDVSGIKLKHTLTRIKNSQAVLAMHPTFRGRAAFEMALTYLYANEPRRALELIASGMEHFDNAKAMATKTTRWKCDLLILKSRAHRLLGDERAAAEAARDALRRAEVSNHVTARINALITLAEVATEFSPRLKNPRQHLLRACDDLKTALDLLRNNPNPKMQAACLLHLARAQHRLGNPVQAREMFEAWRLQHTVEHGYLQRLANAIEDEIGRENGRFSVSSTASTIDIETNVNALKAFLIKVASERAPGDKKKQADLLGISSRHLDRQRDASPEGRRKKPTKRPT